MKQDRSNQEVHATRHESSRGYILVMLLAFITAMGILLTVALPNVKTENQREDEAELVFRGEAIVAAIRAYKGRTGGYPLALADLTKVSPRIIRKLYTDPMTPGGEWNLITAVQPGASGDTTGLPIVGVRSRCQKDSFLIYKGKSLISDWTFSAADNLLGIPAGVAGALGVGGAAGPATTTTTTGTVNNGTGMAGPPNGNNSGNTNPNNLQQGSPNPSTNPQ